MTDDDAVHPAPGGLIRDRPEWAVIANSDGRLALRRSGDPALVIEIRRLSGDAGAGDRVAWWTIALFESSPDSPYRSFVTGGQAGPTVEDVLTHVDDLLDAGDEYAAGGTDP